MIPGATVTSGLLMPANHGTPSVAATTLLDSTKLARDLGVSTWMMKAVKRAAAHYGDTPFTGRYTTVARFDAWLQRHQAFVANHWLRCDRRVTATLV